MDQPPFKTGSKEHFNDIHYLRTAHTIPDGYVLNRLYANQQGIKLSLVTRTKRQRIPTVRQLIEQLSKKHERLLQEELQREKNPSGVTSNSSTTTSSGPYGSDILYGGDVDKSGAECRLGQSNLVDLDRIKDGRRDRDHKKQILSRDSLSLVQEEKEDRANGLQSSNPKINQFKPNGLRNSLVAKGRSYQDDMAAMGTIWSPNVQSKPLRTFSVCTSSNASSSTATAPRRVSSVGVSSGSYKHVFGLPNTNQTSKSLTNSLEAKYSDPLMGAPPQFQQRLAELSTLEADTVRYEKTRKLKKKPVKQDRDS